MRRYWVSKDQIQGDQLSLHGDTFHHIVEVCRQTVGDRFEVLTEDSKAHFVELTEVKKKEATARVLEIRDIQKRSGPQIHLCLSLPKFATFEAVIEKSVELGVTSIKPFVSEFSFLRKLDSISPEKRVRFEKIIKGATQQSGRGDLMKVEPLKNLSQLLEDINRNNDALGLFSYEGDAALTLKKALSVSTGEKLAEIWVFVGSEGGFSTAEVVQFKNAGLEPITLGAQVLRVETACVALVGIIKYELDLL